MVEDFILVRRHDWHFRNGVNEQAGKLSMSKRKDQGRGRMQFLWAAFDKGSLIHFRVCIASYCNMVRNGYVALVGKAGQGTSPSRGHDHWLKRKVWNWKMREKSFFLGSQSCVGWCVSIVWWDDRWSVAGKYLNLAFCCCFWSIQAETPCLKYSRGKSPWHTRRKSGLCAFHWPFPQFDGDFCRNLGSKRSDEKGRNLFTYTQLGIVVLLLASNLWTFYLLQSSARHSVAARQVAFTCKYFLNDIYHIKSPAHLSSLDNESSMRCKLYRGACCIA